ncbi:hypothetical protein [Streptomyces sp. NPDC001843]|uniref:hypothetical protein n=1 Tax=Streptomyces sp. NPDC001843 TaxID=3364617 RepID=UPI0036A1B468
MPHDAVESVLDELYTTPPGRFVARREELAAAARTEGRTDDARRIHAARRPTLAAWAANLLLRSRPEESRQFLELGRALREAYRTLDAAGLKELSGERRRIVSVLSRQAAQLAREAGHGLSDAARQEVESTLRAVLADPDAADRWASGRLGGALTPPADFEAARLPGVSRKPARRTAAPPSASARADELAERRRQRRQQQLDRAREAAERAAQRLREKRAEQSVAEARLTDAERQLDRSREMLRRAERERQRAAEQHAAAGEALARAEREAREAAERADRLAADS